MSTVKSRKELLAAEYADLSPRNPRNKEVKTPSFLGTRNKETTKSQAETEEVADILVEKLQSPKHRDLFLRAAWRYSRETLLRWAAMATEDPAIQNPRAYFIGIMKKEGGYRTKGGGISP